MPKILYVVNVDTFFISHRLPIAVEARAKGYEVHVACRVTSGKDTLIKDQINVHHLDIDRKSTFLLKELMTFLGILKIICTIKPDVVHLVTIKPCIYGGIACRLLRHNRTVFSISGLGYIFTNKRKYANFLRLFAINMYKLAIDKRKNTVIFQNLDDYNLFRNYGIVKKKNIIIIKGSGVDLKEFYPSGDSQPIPIVMLISRMLIDKGIIEFVEASKILQSNGTKVRMVLVGGCDEGNPNAIEQSQLNEWNQLRQIEYWGYKKDVSKIISLASLVVLPSYREGFPKSLIEAAAAGKPIVTTDVPGCRDAIVDGVTGILVPAGDSVSLASAIAYLCKNERVRESMGKQARLFALENFNIQDVVSRHMEIYSSLISLTEACRKKMKPM